MGKDIAQGVVDSKLRVHGVQSLRVVDASVIPVIPDCRIQNSVYMIAEKVSFELWIPEKHILQVAIANIHGTGRRHDQAGLPAALRLEELT